jgi:hypothetical protein
MANLEQVFENDKRFEDYAAKHTAGYEDAEKALEVVKKFIIDKNLILYGGMSIDLALKAKGHKGIYKKSAVPDYDFMSPTHYEHACELAILLNKHGFKDPQAVSAFHVSTYRVRTNYVWVADITYEPPNVFKTIPTITYEGMRMVHPDFQRLDMHRAMSTPYEKPPMEVFLHRGKKDQKRFRMIDELYPIKSLVTGGKSTVPCETAKERIWKVPIKLYNSNVIGGTQAYCVMWMTMNEMLNGTSKLAKNMKTFSKESSVRTRFASLPTGSLSFESGNAVFKLGITCPLLGLVNIITDDYESVLESITDKNTSYFNKYVDDWRPRTVVVTSSDGTVYETFDNKPRLLPVYDVESIFKLLEISTPKIDIKVCTPQYVLMYYLQKYFGGGFVDGELDAAKKPIFLRMYKAMQDMIEIAETLYSELVDVSKGSDHTAVDALFAELPFFLTDKTYGSTNWSPDYIVGFRESNYFINHIPQSEQPVMKPPRGYYLKGPIIPFDRSKSEFFQFDGQKTEPFKPVTLELPTKTKQFVNVNTGDQSTKKSYLKWYDLDY